ncbi:hypothetical protein L209DRAFT_468455 [Thermothelomyces heterothallicus CBS 203.75]
MATSRPVIRLSCEPRPKKSPSRSMPTESPLSVSTARLSTAAQTTAAHNTVRINPGFNRAGALAFADRSIIRPRYAELARLGCDTAASDCGRRGFFGGGGGGGGPQQRLARGEAVVQQLVTLASLIPWRRFPVIAAKSLSRCSAPECRAHPSQSQRGC